MLGAMGICWISISPSCSQDAGDGGSDDQVKQTGEILWGEIDLANWKTTPHVSGRVATELDITFGRAVFCIPEGSTPESIPLPACGIQKDSESGKETPVVIIQAEKAAGEVVLGVRYLQGGNGMCSLNKVEFLDGPDARFK